MKEKYLCDWGAVLSLRPLSHTVSFYQLFSRYKREIEALKKEHNEKTEKLMNSHQQLIKTQVEEVLPAPLPYKTNNQPSTYHSHLHNRQFVFVNFRHSVVYFVFSQANRRVAARESELQKEKQAALDALRAQLKQAHEQDKENALNNLRASLGSAHEKDAGQYKTMLSGLEAQLKEKLQTIQQHAVGVISLSICLSIYRSVCLSLSLSLSLCLSLSLSCPRAVSYSVLFVCLFVFFRQPSLPRRPASRACSKS